MDAGHEVDPMDEIISLGKCSFSEEDQESFMTPEFQGYLSNIWETGLPKSLLNSKNGRILLKLVKMPPHLNPKWSGREVTIGTKTFELPLENESDMKYYKNWLVKSAEKMYSSTN